MVMAMSRFSSSLRTKTLGCLLCAGAVGCGGAQTSGPEPAAGAKHSGPAIAQSCPGGLLEDAEDGDDQAGSNGYWYSYADEAGSKIEPGKEFKLASGGHASEGAVRMQGSLSRGEDVYAGVGFGLREGGSYDASNFRALAFWAKSSSVGQRLRVKVPDVNTAPEGKKCSECYNDFGVEIPLKAEWTRYVVPFGAMKQESDWGAPRPASVDRGELYGVQFQVSEPGATFDVWLDDIEFTGCQ